MNLPVSLDTTTPTAGELLHAHGFVHGFEVEAYLRSSVHEARRQAPPEVALSPWRRRLEGPAMTRLRVTIDGEEYLVETDTIRVTSGTSEVEVASDSVYLSAKTRGRISQAGATFGWPSRFVAPACLSPDGRRRIARALVKALAGAKGRETFAARVDHFAGGGGASTGVGLAAGRSPDLDRSGSMTIVDHSRGERGTHPEEIRAAGGTIREAQPWKARGR